MDIPMKMDIHSSDTEDSDSDSDSFDDSFREDTNKTECKEKVYLRMFFEIHIIPREPNGKKISPITLKREDSLGPEIQASNPAEKRRLNFLRYDSAYNALLRQAAAKKAQLRKDYKGKNYSIYIISKPFKN